MLELFEIKNKKRMEKKKKNQSIHHVIKENSICIVEVFAIDIYNPNSSPLITNCNN